MRTSGTITQEIRDIPLDQLEETELNEYIFGILDSDVDRLAEEIRDHGFTGSIDVMDLHNGTYQVISGHQRLRAVQKLGWRTIPCTVSEDLSDEETYRKLIASNVLGRKITPLGYARAIAVFKEKVMAKQPAIKGTKRAYIAHFFNIAEGQVQRYEAILEMPEEIQQMCDSRDFPYSVLVFAKTFTEKQKQELLRMILDYDEMAEAGTSISAVTLKQYIQAIKDQADRESASKRIKRLMRNAETMPVVPDRSGSSDVPGSSDEAYLLESDEALADVLPKSPVVSGAYLTSMYLEDNTIFNAAYADMHPDSSGNAVAAGETGTHENAMSSSGTETHETNRMRIHDTEPQGTENHRTEPHGKKARETMLSAAGIERMGVDETEFQVVDQEISSISEALTRIADEEFDVIDLLNFIRSINACRAAIEKIAGRIPDGFWDKVK